MSSALPNTAIGQQPIGNSWRCLLDRALGSVRFWWVICLCCAGFLAWAARHSMNPDGLSYLDLASDTLTGGPSKLLSNYWSPGYPAVISLFLFLFRPSPNLEFPLTHLINFLVFLVALWVFTIFLRYWSEATHGKGTQHLVIPFAYSTFLWFMLRFIGVEGVNPDLCIAVFAFLVAGLTCRLYLEEASWKHYITLGLVLGGGYYFKAAMLPLGAGFLALLFLLPPFSKRLSRPNLLLTLSVFLMVAAPLLIALSIRANKLTFGETGRLNYLWFVNGRQWSGGLDPPEAGSIPEHPAPKLLDKPLTLAFASPVGGTYPLWYDPSYWYAGTRTSFSIRQQIKALGVTFKSYKEMIFDSVAFVSGAIVLFVLSRRRSTGDAPHILWWQVAWPLAAFAMYALVTVENRYVGAFFVLFWLAIYGGVMARVDRPVAVAVLATVLCAEMIPFMAHLAMIGGRAATSLVHRSRPPYQAAALGLIGLGLQKGDRLAVVGYAHDCYYARYARLRVAAQIPDAKEFWQLSAPELQTVEKRLASIGVKAVIAPNRPSGDTPGDWKYIYLPGTERLSVRLLSPREPGTPAQ